MKILLVDIETTALVSRTWGTWQIDVIKVSEEWKLLCFAYKYLGEKTVKVEASDTQSEKELVKKLHEIFCSADVIVAHNGNRFDIKKSNAKFIEFGLEPPSQYQKIDTLLVAKQNFAFTSNKLNDLGKLLGVGEKVKHPGFEMWEGCERGEEKWWKLMKRYTKMDITLLEKVYLKLRPWMPNHPNLNVVSGSFHACPKCNSKKVTKRGYGYSRTGVYRKYQCTDCRGWSRGTSSETVTDIK